MACRFSELVIDCRDPQLLGDFWAAVLGYEVSETSLEGEHHYVELTGPPGSGPSVLLLRAPDERVVKNRVHIDVNATDRDQGAEVDRIVGLGAKHVDIGQGDQTWVVLADPEGNEFCVLRSRVEPYDDPSRDGAAVPQPSLGSAPVSRAVVVGAGLGGLAVAARLSALGHRVTVCEQAPTVGGKLGTYSRDGFTFDTGPSLLTLPAVFRDLFQATGGPLEQALDLVEVEPAFRYRFPDGTWVELPSLSAPGVAAAYDDALGPGCGADWTRLMARARDIWAVTRGPFLESPLDGAGRLARLALRAGDVRTVAPWASLRTLGRRYLRDPRQRMVLDRYATYTGSDPRRAPAALAVVPYVEQTFGSWWVRGGLRRLALAVHDRAVERGAVVRTGSEVTRVLVESGRASGVQLAGGERIPADVVVSAGDAALLYRDLLSDRAADAARRRLGRATPSLSGFVLLLALRGRAAPVQHTVLFPADYDAEFDAVFGAEPEPARDPTIYVSAPDDAVMRPDDDHEAWFVLVNAPRHGPVDWAAPGLPDAYADRVLDVMAQRGLDVRHRLLWREIRTPADLERDTRSPGGAIYGSSSNGARSAFLRPANRSPVPGLFLVGGSSHPGGGLPLVGLSAAIVADLVGPAE